MPFEQFQLREWAAHGYRHLLHLAIQVVNPRTVDKMLLFRSNICLVQKTKIILAY